MTTLTAASPSAGGMLAGARPRSRPAQSPGPFGGLDVLRIMRRRAVMITLIWLFAVGATIALTAYMIRYYPEYGAAAMIKVESIYPVDPLDPLSRNQASKQELDRAVRNQAALVKSYRVMNDTLADDQVKQTSWYTWASQEANNKGALIQDILSDMISAAPLRDSSYLQVGASWRIPSEVAVIVNSVVDRYMNLTEDLQRTDLRTAKDSLQVALNEAQKEFDDSEKQIQVFRSQHQVIGRGDEPNEALMTLTALATELDMDVRGRKAQYENLEQASPEQLPITPDMEQALLYDADLQQKRNRMDGLQIYLEGLRTKFGPNHRNVKDVEKQLELATNNYDTERALKLLDIKNQQIQLARRNYFEANQMLLEVQDALIEKSAEQRDRDNNLITLNRLLEKRDDARLRLAQIKQQFDVVTMTISARRVVQIQVVQRATEPKRRTSPTYGSWVPIGTVAGLLLGIGLAVLLELADKSVRIPADVARSAALPVLATIPTSDDDEIEIPRVETACLDAPHSIIAEAFRQLRANLFFSAPLEQQGVILVTSPSGGNGKTTIATNLAISIALSGRRVLLIDANFRRPALPRIFPNMKTDGLSNILIGQARLAELVTSTSVPGLDVLGAGPTPPNPAELLGSSYLRDVVVDARARYDQVIFDGPPILLVSDAAVLAGAVDGVLIVCQYRSTSRGALARARSQLETINSRIFGAVLNRVETRAGGYYRRHYREFYEYHQPDEDELPPPLPPKQLDEQPRAEKKKKRPKSPPPAQPGKSDASSRARSTPPVAESPPAWIEETPAEPPSGSATRATAAPPWQDEAPSEGEAPAEPTTGAPRVREVEPEPEDEGPVFRIDTEPEPLDDLGDIKIDESLGLGADDETAPGRPSAPPAQGKRPGEDPLDLGDFKLNTDFDLGGSDLGLDDEFKLEDEPDDDDAAGPAGKPKP